MMFYPIAKNNNDNNNQSSDKNDEKYLEVTQSEMAKGTTAAQSWKTSSVALFRLLSTANGIAYCNGRNTCNKFAQSGMQIWPSIKFAIFLWWEDRGAIAKEAACSNAPTLAVAF